MSSLSIHEADAAALAAINTCYATIHFAPSEWPRDRTFYGVLDPSEPALRGEAIACLGRINGYPDAIEIGGFWVREDLRGTGVARRLVEHVIHALPRGQLVYCVPFVHLVPFYLSFGMQVVDTREGVPASIASKLGYCQKQHALGFYAHGLALLSLCT